MANDPQSKKSEERTVLFNAQGKRRDAATMIVKTAEIKPDEALFKFVAIRGPRQGKQFPLRGTEITVGRDEKNDVIIPDISVSRRHARLRRRATGWTIASLGPDSAVRVNGLKVEEHPLASGDLVELGKAELQFVASDAASVRTRTGEQAAREREAGRTRATAAAAPKRPRPPPNPRIRKVAIGCFAVVALSLAIKGLVIGRRPHRSRQPVIEQREDLFAQARKEVLAQHWVQARDLLADAAKDDPENPQLRRYLEIAKAEVVNQQHSETAAKALAAKDLKAAAAELAAIPADSLLADQANAERGQVDQAVKQQVDAARTALAAGDLPAAASAIGIALGGDPRNPAALELQGQIDAKQTGRKLSAEEAARQAALAAIEKRRQSGPIGGARDAFKNGNIKGALSLLNEVPAADVGVANRLQDDITRCNQTFEKGVTAAGNEDTGRAAELLTRARSQADEIVAGSTIASEANAKLGALELKLGTEARGAGRVGDARRHFERALQANAKNDQAAEELKRLEADGHEKFVEAYAKRNDDKEAAERLFRQVVEMTAPSDDDHKRAAEWLERLRSK